MRKQLLTLALLAALPVAANAAEISYDYVQVDYIHLDGDDSADNGRLVGSATLGDSHFYLTGSYMPEGDIPHYEHTHDDFDMASFGVGYFWNLGDATTLHVQGSTQNDGWTGDNALRLDVGVRHAFGDNWEIGGGIGYLDHAYGYYGEQFLYNVNAQYKFNETWGLVLSAEFGDFTDEDYDVTFDKVYTFGVRASF